MTCTRAVSALAGFNHQRAGRYLEHSRQRAELRKPIPAPPSPDPSVPASCLARARRDPGLVDLALLPEGRTALADATTVAFANGVFGVPTFVCNDEVFFGNDRLEMLQWRLGR